MYTTNGQRTLSRRYMSAFKVASRYEYEKKAAATKDVESNFQTVKVCSYKGE